MSSTILVGSIPRLGSDALGRQAVYHVMLARVCFVHQRYHDHVIKITWFRNFTSGCCADWKDA
jgi:hypothetical protein